MTYHGAGVCGLRTGDPRQLLGNVSVEVVPVVVLQLTLPQQPPEIGVIQPQREQDLPALRSLDG